MVTKKIGILTFFDEKNYGAALQAFSLQEKIKTLGHKPYFINWHDSLNKTRSKASNFSRLKKFFFQYKFNIKSYKTYRSCSSKTINLFIDFKNIFFKIDYTPVYDYDDLKVVAYNYNGFIAGSDMVWTDIGQDLYTYFLQFAPFDKRGSYSPSLTGLNQKTEQEKIQLTNYIKSIKCLSFREREAVEFAKKECQREAILTVDPTLLHTKEEWCKLLNINNKCTSKPYMLCYMFGGIPSRLNRKIKKFAEYNNFDIRYIPMTVDEVISDISQGNEGAYGPKEFVELFFNASFVITNSYHGFLFSLIANIPYVVIEREKNNKWKANEERISCLLNLIGETKRYLTLEDSISIDLLKIDYEKINQTIAKLVNKSLDFLRFELETFPEQLDSNIINLDKTYNISGIDKKKCVGCTVCKSTCSQDAILLKEDAEGFSYPVVDENKCIRCKKCLISCQSFNLLNLNKPIKTYFGFSLLPEQKYSASGGAFYTLAKNFLQNKGVVFGATLDKSNICKHIAIYEANDLYKLQGSKYVESNLGNTYSEIKNNLDKKINVLFSGTPCQVAGLYKYLGKDYCNLYTIDLVCHGVPSQKLFSNYISFLMVKGNISNLTFRNKENESKTRSAFVITYCQNNKKITRQALNDPYYKLFVENITFKTSCYYCKYATSNRIGDITIGDCDSWRVQQIFIPEKAKSIMLINTEKGQRLFSLASSNFQLKNLDYKKEILMNTPLSQPTPKPEERKFIYENIAKAGWSLIELKDTLFGKVANLISRII